MGFTVETPEQAGPVPQVTLDRKLWLTADKSRVVEDGDPEAAFLYGIEGHQKPRPEVIELGALPKKELRKQARKLEENKQTQQRPDKQGSSEGEPK